jgi:preprotein translocase subunit SecA
LIHTFERNLNEHWSLKESDLMHLSWEEIEAKLLAKIEESLKRSEDLILGESGYIARDLEKNSSKLEEALQDPSALMSLLIMMMFGRVITFDDTSHKRKFKAKARLNYIFLAAQQLEGHPVEEVQKKVLDHLEKAQDRLSLIYGQARLEDLQARSLTLGDLEKEDRPVAPKLVDAFGEERFEELKTLNIDQLPEQDQQTAVKVFGHHIQNNYYRQLLLSHISSLWVDYLTKVEALRISVKMEAYAQRDPLVQYKGQASEMFSQLLSDIRAAVIHQMFRARRLRTSGPRPVQKIIRTKTKVKKKKKSSSKRHRHK